MKNNNNFSQCPSAQHLLAVCKQLVSFYITAFRLCLQYTYPYFKRNFRFVSLQEISFLGRSNFIVINYQKVVSLESSSKMPIIETPTLYNNNNYNIMVHLWICRKVSSKTSNKNQLRRNPKNVNCCLPAISFH